MEHVTQFVSNNLFLFIAFFIVLAMLIKAEYEHQTSRSMQLSSAQAVRLLNNNPDVLVLDIRASKDFGNGHIGQAVNIPIAELKNELEKLAKYKDKQVLVYCNSGNTSSKAEKILQGNGFANINNLQGGIANWTEAGLPLTKK